MHTKSYSFIKIIVFLLGFTIFMISCEKSTNAPQSKQTSVRFVFEKNNGQPSGSLFFDSEKLNATGSNPVNATSKGREQNSFHKLNEIAEAKVLFLDMTQWETEEAFFEAWYGSGQNELIDTTLWNDNLDYWNNIKSAVYSYTGEYFRIGGEVDLNIQNGLASGTVTVNPGLNYFFICLRENQRTVYYDEFSWIIVEGEENTIRVQATPALYIQIYSPQDSAVFQQSQEIFLNGFAEDMLNYDDIPDSNYVWTSDKDGELGRGSYTVASGLSVNQHRITLTVTTTAGLSGSEQVNIEVIP